MPQKAILVPLPDRTIDRKKGRSVLVGQKTTCLLKPMERPACFSTAWKLGRSYRTYDAYDAYVEDEVRASLAAPTDFVRGPFELQERGTDAEDTSAFVVEDGRSVSARWPDAAYLFGTKLLERLA